MNKAAKYTQYRRYKKIAVWFAVSTFLFNQVAFAAEPVGLQREYYAQTQTLSEAQNKAAVAPIPQEETSQAFLDNTLELTPVKESEIADAEVSAPAADYDSTEYSFEDALAQISPDYASAVIVKNLTESDIKALVNQKIEIGIAVIEGKTVLFTSGNEDEIRANAVAKQLLTKASLIAHTHPIGHSAQPSLEDIQSAGDQVEYVISALGVFAYNKDGLTSQDPLSYASFASEVQKKQNPAESTVEARKILNEFIRAIDEYNQDPNHSELLRSAGPTIFPGLPRLGSFDSGSPAANFAVVQQVDSTQTDPAIRILHNTYNTASGSYGGSIISFSSPADLSASTKFTFDFKTDNNTANSCGSNRSNCVKVEFVDVNNRVAAVYITNITSTFKQYDILRTTLDLSNSNLDYTQIKQINFVIDSFMVAGKNDGYFDVRAGGLYFEPSVAATTGPVTNLTPNAVSVSELEPQGHNTVTGFTQSSMNQLSFNYDLTNGADNDFSRWGGVLFSFGNAYNLTSGDLVLSLKGTGTSKLKMDITSGTGANAKKVTVIVTGLTDTAQFYHISKALVDQAAIPGFDPANITSIAIVVDDQNAGSKTASGTVEIVSQGLRSSYVIDPDTTGATITLLPVTSTGARPSLNAFASFNPAQNDYSNADVTVYSQTFAQLHVNNYNTTSYSGVFVNYDDPNTTSATETINLDALYPNGMVLGLDNAGTDLTQVKLEVTDINGKTDFVYLNGIENFGKNWKIAISKFDEVDTTKIKTISIVVEGKNVDKKLSIDWGNYYFVPGIPADPANPNITPLPLTSFDADRPSLVGFASYNPNDADPDKRDFSKVDAKALSPTFAQLDINLYNTFSYGGAFINYDNPATTNTKEVLNLQTAFPNGLVLGLDNGGTDLTEVTIELTDANGKTDRVKLVGIENFGKHWKVLASQFDEIDTTKITVVTLLIEGKHVGKKLNVDWGNWAAPQAPDTTNPAISLLPNTSTGARVGFNGFASIDPQTSDYSTADVTVSSQTFGTVNLNLYNTTSYGGVYFNYDDASTPAKETINLNTAFSNGIVFGLDNGGTDITEVSLEVRDDAGKTDTVVLGDVKNFGQKWKVLASQFDDVDVTKITTISLVVLGRHVGGKLNVDWGNYYFVPGIPADPANPNITPLPLTSFDADRPSLVGFASYNPNDADPDKRDFSKVDAKALSPTFAQLDINLYNTFSYGGAFINYDNPATTNTKEVLNLQTAFPNGLVLGLDNGGTDLTEVTIELTDANGKTDRVKLVGIENFGKHWKVLASQFDEIDTTKITVVTLLIEGKHVGKKLNVDWGNWAAPQAPDTTNPAISLLPLTSLNEKPLAQGFASYDPVNSDFSESTVVLASETFATVNMNLYNTNSYGGMFINYDNAATSNTKESINLNTVFPNGIVFGLDNGGTDITEVSLEVRDDAGKTDSVVLGDIKNFGQKWKVLASQFDDVDVTKITTISLVVLGRHVGGKLNVDWGNFGGFIPPIPADGSNPNITFLPLDHNGKRVSLNGFASYDPANSDYSNTGVDMISATFAALNLNLYNKTSFGGAYISYDDFGTPGVKETINLDTQFPNGIVVGLDNGGTALTEVELEITDINGAKDSVKLVGIESFGKRWKVLTNQFESIDRTQITTISIVVKGKHVGEKVNVDWGLFDFTPGIQPDANNPAITSVPLLSTGDRPALTAFASYNPNDPDPAKQDYSNGKVVMDSLSAGKISLNLYNTFSYGGAFLNYDNPATPAKETINLSTAFSSGIVLGLSSNDASLDEVKLQVTDINGNTDSVVLVNVGTTTKRWKIMPSAFDQVDITKITTLSLLVEGKYIGLDLSFEWGDFYFIPFV